MAPGDAAELRDATLVIRGPVVEWLGPDTELPEALLDEARSTGRVIDASGLVLMPGLVNTHHHMFQTLTRALPGAQDAGLFAWLRTHYPVWARLTPEMLATSTQLAAAELLLSGVTTSSDHAYLFPNGCTLDDTLHAVEATGLRFHAARGAMSVGESAGGLPPDAVVEREPDILADSERLIARWHDPDRLAMRRIVLAPCSPFSVSPGLMRDAALLARQYPGVHLHTHLAENDHDITYTRERFGCTPDEYAEQLGWLGPDVWHAHCVKLAPAGIARFAASGTGVAHCPGSNMRLGSGIAPIRAMVDAGVPVSVAVDGSASNDASHGLAELRLALLLQRVALGAEAFGVREMLALGTRGGARVLGRDDAIGHLAPGMAADLIGVRLDRLALAGAQHDPLAALLLCAVPQVDLSVVHGRICVEGGELQTLELQALVARHNRLAGLLRSQV
jgi:cytosine/adenosine deaminase-related metal-dependent hydrolase